mmetsp:Transcript_33101/g.102771  ORF Transcript_33101/g.102771 Transcript_33101/m.102771 type:complete len:373 (+) Transcript_33101:129-1247(+)
MNKARAMLDALMGPGRDEMVKDQAKKKEKFKDRSVCKHFLVGLCPLDKDMLGGKRKFNLCERLHSELMREQFEAHPEAKTLRGEYERSLLLELEYVVRECDNHIAAERTRIREDLRRKKPALPGPVNDKLAMMKRESSAMIQRAEALDDEHLVEKQALITKSAELMKERDEYQQKETQKAIDAVEPEEVCEVCGVSYTGKDGDAAHMSFRIHEAYARIRKYIDELRPRVESLGPPAPPKEAAAAQEAAAAARDDGRERREEAAAGEGRERKEDPEEPPDVGDRSREAGQNGEKGKSLKGRSREKDDRSRDKARSRDRGGGRRSARQAGRRSPSRSRSRGRRRRRHGRRPSRSRGRRRSPSSASHRRRRGRRK